MKKDNYKPAIIKGDKSIDPTGLFGIWKDRARTLAEIRKKAWGRRDKITQDNNKTTK